MNKITITEALAELNTISKRVEKKRGTIQNFLYRPDLMRDPLQKEGGSADYIAKERQAIKDLEDRHVRIRMAIQQANQKTEVTVNGTTKTLADWLTWRKEVSPGVQTFLANVRTALERARREVQQRGGKAVAGAEDSTPRDIIVNVNEAELASEAEELEKTLGDLDGQLSLKNATVTIEI